eukprot:3519774-Rhodomonas_salina.1
MCCHASTACCLAEAATVTGQTLTQCMVLQVKNALDPAACPHETGRLATFLRRAYAQSGTDLGFGGGRRVPVREAPGTARDPPGERAWAGRARVRGLWRALPLCL